MAPGSRIRLLLPLTLLCSFGFVVGLKGASRPAEPPEAPNHRHAEPPGKDAPAAAAAAVVAGASPPRRATGWKLAEEEACREDLTRLCPRHTWANNLAVLECLQDRREVRQRRRSRAGYPGAVRGWSGRLGVSARWFRSTPAGTDAEKMERCTSDTRTRTKERSSL